MLTDISVRRSIFETAAYPDLERKDIREALRYAAEAVRERELPVAGGGKTLLA